MELSFSRMFRLWFQPASKDFCQHGLFRHRYGFLYCQFLQQFFHFHTFTLSLSHFFIFFFLKNPFSIVNINGYFFFLFCPKINQYVPLRYYATFKVRKCELLFQKINIFLQKSTFCIGLQAEQLSKHIINVFFNFGLLRFFSFVISKSSSFLL